MTTTREHELIATYIIEQLDTDSQSRGELLQLAQLRATLAVVGQLRISNLMMLAGDRLNEDPDVVEEILDALKLEATNDPQ